MRGPASREVDGPVSRVSGFKESKTLGAYNGCSLASAQVSIWVRREIGHQWVDARLQLLSLQALDLFVRRRVAAPLAVASWILLQFRHRCVATWCCKVQVCGTLKDEVVQERERKWEAEM
jgi:hypothetical protein